MRQRLQLREQWEGGEIFLNTKGEAEKARVWGLGKSNKGCDSQISLNNWRELYQEDQGRKGIPGRRSCTLRDTVGSSGGRSKGWEKGYGRKEAEDIRGQSTWGLASHDESVTSFLQQARVMEEL